MQCVFRRSDGGFQAFQGLYLFLGLQQLLVGTGSDEPAVGVALHELIDVLLTDETHDHDDDDVTMNNRCVRVTYTVKNY